MYSVNTIHPTVYIVHDHGLSNLYDILSLLWVGLGLGLGTHFPGGAQLGENITYVTYVVVYYSLYDLYNNKLI